MRLGFFMAKLTQSRLYLHGRQVELELKADEPIRSASLKVLGAARAVAGGVRVDPPAEAFSGKLRVNATPTVVDELQVTADFASGQTCTFSVYGPPAGKWVYFG